jgi:hypothetical protein
LVKGVRFHEGRNIALPAVEGKRRKGVVSESPCIKKIVMAKRSFSFSLGG